jgi:voltage-gated potassium channel
VPTGIISSEMTMQNRLFRLTATRTCPECLSEGHEADARFCKDCGAPLPAYQRDR